ncbi:MAG: FliG C-terminal domain-containing protein [Candidatus Hinthialibacter antarcticus]|nr:FliG C-terminal domain-containing protein [Candidatus Hinthialibacter antarcticus]
MSDQTARIKEMLSALSKQKNKSKKGLQTLIGMLGQMDRQTEQTIMRTLDQQYPDLAQSLREQYFTFEDLVSMEDAVLKRAFEEVHRSTLAASLKGQPQPVRDKVLINLSPRAAAMLEDDMDAMGPQPRHIVEEAQREVTEALKRWRNVIL